MRCVGCCVFEVLIPVFRIQFGSVVAALSGCSSRRIDKRLLLMFSGLIIEQRGVRQW